MRNFEKFEFLRFFLLKKACLAFSINLFETPGRLNLRWGFRAYLIKTVFLSLLEQGINF